MEEMEILLEILEKSIEKNGDKVITLSHLKNIIKLVIKETSKDDDFGTESDIY